MEEDRAAYDAIINGMRPRLIFLVRRAGVPAEDCEDVVHNALVSALSQLDRKAFRGESSLATWMRTIANGKIADYWRSHVRQKRLVKQIESSEESENQANLTDILRPGQFKDPLDARILNEALGRLRTRHRIALILFEVQGIKAQEIGARLGWPTGTVYRILSEARRELAKYIGGGEERAPLKRQIGQGGKQGEQS